MTAKSTIREYRNSQIQKILGGVVLGARHTPDYLYFGLLVQMPDSTIYTVWIDADDEGNGSGSITIEKEKIK
jgi:hypothetical protein